MSTTTLEKTAVDTGSDLAGLVIAYHRMHHMKDPDECTHEMCRVAHECLDLDLMFFGTGD